MTAAELIRHTFPWEVAPGVPRGDADDDVAGCFCGHPQSEHDWETYWWSVACNREDCFCSDYSPDWEEAA